MRDFAICALGRESIPSIRVPENDELISEEFAERGRTVFSWTTKRVTRAVYLYTIIRNFLIDHCVFPSSIRQFMCFNFSRKHCNSMPARTHTHTFRKKFGRAHWFLIIYPLNDVFFPILHVTWKSYRFPPPSPTITTTVSSRSWIFFFLRFQTNSSLFDEQPLGRVVGGGRQHRTTFCIVAAVTLFIRIGRPASWLIDEPKVVVPTATPSV